MNKDNLTGGDMSMGVNELYEALKEMTMSYNLAVQIATPKTVAGGVIVGAFGNSPKKAEEALEKYSKFQALKQRSNHEAYMLSLQAGDALSFHETSVPRP